MQLKKLVSHFVLATCLASPALTAHAQSLPGNAIQENTVSADVITLFSLAAEVAPAFKSGSAWYSYSGYTYKFFAGAGIYAGVKDGNVYLIGGPYGPALTPRFTLGNAIASLQALKASQQNSNQGSVNFGTVASVKTTADLPRLFQELTLEWYTASLTTQLKMERIGVEQVGGTSTERVRMTVSGFNAATPIVSELWIDSTGVARRFVSAGFEYPAAQADLLSKNITAAMMIALAGAETPSVKTGIEAALKSPAATKDVKKTTLGGGSYDMLTITIGNTQSLHYVSDITDLGSFSMVTRIEGRIGATMANGYSIVDMKLR